MQLFSVLRNDRIISVKYVVPILQQTLKDGVIKAVERLEAGSRGPQEITSFVKSGALLREQSWEISGSIVRMGLYFINILSPLRVVLFDLAIFSQIGATRGLIFS